MDIELDAWLDNRYLATLAFFAVVVLVLVLFLTIFELITRYEVWAEIKAGNVSVAMATGGKILGICNLFRFAILKDVTMLQTLIWAGFGFVLLLAAYFIFEFLTPYFKIDEEIKKDNRAVGLLAMMISVSISYVVGACIT
ncbi:DUF350 domain-containing protein [Paenibacillus eucommiae]|uniref:Membrane protein n=1 Tax=Paenibacillus eucommiae TaxID=1355755 RepID=A0ABS4J126_9BACL|nr:DUF350 domain-containing protein [Paenibacillus eucommiae]MBP1993516.1 putative membrane protein [Paenibacillus eucommiae]